MTSSFEHYYQPRRGLLGRGRKSATSIKEIRRLCLKELRNAKPTTPTKEIDEFAAKGKQTHVLQRLFTCNQLMPVDDASGHAVLKDLGWSKRDRKTIIELSKQEPQSFKHFIEELKENGLLPCGYVTYSKALQWWKVLSIYPEAKQIPWTCQFLKRFLGDSVLKQALDNLQKENDDHPFVRTECTKLKLDRRKGLTLKRKHLKLHDDDNHDDGTDDESGTDTENDKQIKRKKTT